MYTVCNVEEIASAGAYSLFEIRAYRFFKRNVYSNCYLWSKIGCPPFFAGAEICNDDWLRFCSDESLAMDEMEKLARIEEEATKNALSAN